MQNTTLTKKTSKKTLRELYNNMNSDQKKQFIETVKTATGRHFTTIYNWVSKKTEPSFSEKTILANALKVRVSDINF